MPSNHIWVVRTGEQIIGAGTTYYSATTEARSNGLGAAVSLRLEEGAERGARVVVTGGGYSLTRETLASTGGSRDAD